MIKKIKELFKKEITYKNIDRADSIRYKTTDDIEIIAPFKIIKFTRGFNDKKEIVDNIFSNTKQMYYSNMQLHSIIDLKNYEHITFKFNDDNKNIHVNYKGKIMNISTKRTPLLDLKNQEFKCKKCNFVGTILDFMKFTESGQLIDKQICPECMSKDLHKGDNKPIGFNWEVRISMIEDLKKGEKSTLPIE